MRLIEILGIVLFILVFIGIIVFIFKKLNKDNFSNKLIEESGVEMIAGGFDLDIPEEILKLINVKKWPQVSTLTNQILLTTPLESFYYSEKTDGEHKNILIYDRMIYDVTHYDNIMEISEIDCDETMILDTELYKNKFYIFDVYYVNDKLVKDEHFKDRMKYMNEKMKLLGDKFILKQFYPIPSIEFLLDFINHDKSPTTGNEIDGVILQRIDKPYFPTKFEANIYKLKPRHLMTIDFLLKYNSTDNSYELYSIGSFRDMINSLTKIPKSTKNVYDKDGNEYLRKDLSKLPESVLILFDSPFIPNLSKYYPSKKWNSVGYFNRIIHHVDELIAQFHQFPGNFDNKIVEMSLTNDNQWVPIRIRTDKLLPNGFHIAQTNVSLIFDPIKTIDQIYFHKDLKSESQTQDYIHKINQIFRKYVIEKHINPLGRYTSIIDLCGGRGADQYNLYANGVTNFFAIDGDTTALKQYIDKSYQLKAKYMFNQYKDETRYKPLIKPWKKNVAEKGNIFTINALHHVLGNNYENILKDLKSRVEWTGSVKIVLMNFAIHYLCDKLANITKLANFINSVLDDTGIFIVTYFDGDFILDNAQTVGKKEISKIGPFEIEIISKTINITKAKMPLPTIQGTDDFYREEPLVHSNIFKPLDTKLKLLDEYYIYDNTSSEINKISRSKEFKSLLEYYKIIKARVYTKK